MMIYINIYGRYIYIYIYTRNVGCWAVWIASGGAQVLRSAQWQPRRRPRPQRLVHRLLGVKQPCVRERELVLRRHHPRAACGHGAAIIPSDGHHQQLILRAKWLFNTWGKMYKRNELVRPCGPQHIYIYIYIEREIWNKSRNYNRKLYIYKYMKRIP